MAIKISVGLERGKRVPFPCRWVLKSFILISKKEGSSNDGTHNISFLQLGHADRWRCLGFHYSVPPLSCPGWIPPFSDQLIINPESAAEVSSSFQLLPERSCQSREHSPPWLPGQPSCRDEGLWTPPTLTLSLWMDAGPVPLGSWFQPQPPLLGKKGIKFFFFPNSKVISSHNI